MPRSCASGFISKSSEGRQVHNEIVLVIGNKAWSSWSLRPWLAAKVAGIPFREEHVQLRQPDSAAQIARHSPSARVPVLKRGALAVWDSLAICEYLAEISAHVKLWPDDPAARAVARSVAAEMHSSFHALRKELSMDFHARVNGVEPSDAAKADIARIVAVWRDTRKAYGAGGSFLFGAFSVADAMYAPVATRFRTYGINLAAFGDDGTAAAYAHEVLDLPAMHDWGQGAAREGIAAR
nr:glutathione S-transferase family protein [Rhodomicrobium udaipurense]